MADNDPIATLTETEQKIVSILPATHKEIANTLDITRSTSRDHLSSIKSKGVPISSRQRSGESEFYHRSEAREHPTNDLDTVARPSGESKAKITRRTTDAMRDLENRLLRILNNSQPAVADGGMVQEPSHEDVVIHATDDHIGDKTEDEFGNTTFDTELAVGRREETFDTCFELIQRQRSAGYEFDCLHLLMGGDIVTGETIYESQPHDIEKKLDEQVDIASTLYMEQIRRAASQFEQVQVVCQSGNHGELRANGSSERANADRLVYLMLDAMVRESDLDNVTFIRNQSTHFTNFRMRDHRGHLRHGDDSLEHIGTSSGKRRWFNWRDKHQFDVAYRGHYHQFQYDTLTRTEIVNDHQTQTRNVPVVMTGSPKPPEAFEESIAKWSQPSATIHGVSDERPVTWFFPVDFE